MDGTTDLAAGGAEEGEASAAGFALAAAAVVADAGAIGLGFVAPAGGGGFPDVVAGLGLTAGASVIDSGALLLESSTGDGLAARAGVALMDGRGSGTVSGCLRTTGAVGSSALIEPAS